MGAGEKILRESPRALGDIVKPCVLLHGGTYVAWCDDEDNAILGAWPATYIYQALSGHNISTLQAFLFSH